MAAISELVPQWKQDVIATYEVDSLATDFKAEAAVVHPNDRRVTIDGGIIKINSQIYVGASPLRQQLIKEFHDSSWGGHSGVLPTYKKIAAIFYWQKMK